MKPWEASTRSVVANLMQGDSQSFAEVVYAEGLSAHDLFPGGPYREAFRAITSVAIQNLVITPATVFAESRGKVPMEWLENIAGVLVMPDEGRSAAKQCVKFAGDEHFVDLLDQAGKAIADKPVSEVKAWLTAEMSKVKGGQMGDNSPRGIRERIEARIDRGQSANFTHTRNLWFDFTLRGGFWPGMLLVIGAPEKNRKTTILRNLLLGAAMNKDWTPNPKASIALLTFENGQELTYYDFVAMLASAYAYKHGWEDEPIFIDGAEIPMKGLLSGMDLKIWHGQKKVGWRRHGTHISAAIEWAMNHFDTLPISIYDQSEVGGGLTNMDSLFDVARYHKYARTGDDQHFIVAQDYAQLAANTGKIYEDMKAYSGLARNFAAAENATFIALSQFNQPGKQDLKGNNKGKTPVPVTDFVPTKGGGELAEAAHVYYAVSYSGGETIHATVARSRIGPGGEQKSFKILAASGLIVDGTAPDTKLLTIKTPLSVPTV